MAKANTSGLAVRGKQGQRLLFMDVNGGEASLRWITSFLEETAHHLMNRQPTCQYSTCFTLNNIYRFNYFFYLPWKKCCFIREVTDFPLRWDSLLIHSYGISKWPLSFAQLWLKFNDIKNVTWLVIKAHVIQVPYQSVTFDVTSEWLTNGISPESPITFEC